MRAKTTGEDQGPSLSLLKLSNVSKSFAGVRALENVGLELAAGEIRGLLGQNGSGKSTLIKILSGYHSPDPGTQLEVDGAAIPLPLAVDATHRIGVAFVHQDLALAEAESVTDNVRIKMFGPRAYSRIRWSHERRMVEQSLAELGIDIPANAIVGELGEAQQTVVALARAISEIGGLSRGILVVDEATASLPANAVGSVLNAVRTLAERGFGVLYVSHRLEEVMEIADTVTVLRDGRVVLDAKAQDLTRSQLIEAIVGGEYDEYEVERKDTATPACEETILDIERLSGVLTDGVTLESIRPGEVIGITGLVGSGFEEVPSLLFGAEQADAGLITWKGVSHQANSLRPDRARALGFAYVPATRLGKGAVGSALIRENASLPWLSRISSRGWLRSSTEHDLVSDLLRTYDVRPPDPDAAFTSLSGGNQQKVLLGRELATEPGLLLLAEPTHGIDVAAKSQILHRIREFADAGNVAIVGSSEIDELVRICDRVAVLKEGRVVKELYGQQIEAQRILRYCYA